MALAQPTLLSTLIAPGSQFSAHAPHSMQESGSTSLAAPPFPAANTRCGQTTEHMPQRVQSSGSYSRVFNLLAEAILSQPLFLPNRRRAPFNSTPDAAIAAMTGTYLLISLRTPVGEANVVAPVKLRAIKDVIAGRVST